MTIKSRTIDNLGVEASIRYAKDQTLFDPKYIEESRLIPQKTEVPVATPYVLSEFDQLFSLGKTLIWAFFTPPPNYLGDGRSLFSYQMIPSLGGYEKLEADADTLESLEEKLAKHWNEKRKQKQEEEDQDSEEAERERKVLAALFECLSKFDKALALIHARRNQYQRG